MNVHSAVGHYRTVRALEYFEVNNFEHAVAIDGGYLSALPLNDPPQWGDGLLKGGRNCSSAIFRSSRKVNCST
jgi:hypothetical protein